MIEGMFKIETIQKQNCKVGKYFTRIHARVAASAFEFLPEMAERAESILWTGGKTKQNGIDQFVNSNSRRSPIRFARKREKRNSSGWRIVIPAGEKKSAIKYSARVPWRRKSAFQLSVRAFARADGGNFGLTANTPVNSSRSPRKAASRPRAMP